ncbi:GIY-YIG nuclease family protein [Algoriphagus aquimarinus]|uniref:GIY-YIG nuclease family protein n=1 Tax=Algoriphagus aquimarinus TaxID=237018 RepID=A0A5C7AJ97_9BACT|nr:GIY-YIG nuclease family protein [Algoriphagus aquimarinus]TXE06665.1 GIY-YIG nuclease family protein [Algoriphagus aquimarinus]
MDKINLNEILQIKDLSNVKIRFNLMFRDNWNPIEDFKNDNLEVMFEGHYHNYPNKRSYKEGQMTIAFVKIHPKENYWLLFHIGKVTKDLNIFNGIGYEYEPLKEYEKYFGRLIIRFKNKSQMMIRNAASVIDECEVSQLLPDTFDNDLFPGYDKVNVSWKELKRVIEKDTWKTALENQKGVYLLTDISNGKQYVGSAYGESMILGRWRSYIRNGHGGNIGLIPITFIHIQENFRFSILDIYKSTTDDLIIIARENWWKQILQSRRFGYNVN